MSRFLLAVFALIAALVGVAVWIGHDANRFKPALVGYMEREIGSPVEIRGDLEWRLRPGLGLMASDIHAVYAGRAWTVERLLLQPELVSMLRNPTTLADWRIARIDIDGLNVAVGAGHLRIRQLALRGPHFASEAAFAVKAEYGKAAQAPVPIELDGVIALSTGRLRVSNTAFRLPSAGGVCDLEILAAEIGPPMPMGVASPSQIGRDAGVGRQGSTSQRPDLRPIASTILPVELMRAYDWDGRCDIHRLSLGAEVVESTQVVLDNKNGGSIVSWRAASFLGGEAQLQMVVRAGQAPVGWEIEPHLSGVDSHRLGLAFGMDSVVSAPLDLSGAIGLAGDSPQDLAPSLDADVRFSTSAGTLNLDWIAAPLASIGDRLGAGGEMAELRYEKLTGRWRATGERNRLNIDLDSASLEVEGDYWILKDQLDLIGAVTFSESAQRWGLPLPPGIAALPFHFRCRGALGRPDCRLDPRRTFLGGTVDKGRAKADEFINSFVPEDYRGRARSLLDSLGSRAEDSLRKDPEGLIDNQVPEKYRDAARSLLESLQGDTKDEQ